MILKLREKRPETEGVYSFDFEPEAPLQWQPGQYLHYKLPQANPDERGDERWFTIASAPFEKIVRITTRFDGERVSSFKQALLAMEPGGQIEADGPKGSFLLKDGEYHHIMIAGGIGITPYRSMLMQLAHERRPARVDLLYANRDNNFVFGDELKRLQQDNPTLNILEFVDKRIAEPDLQKYLDHNDAVFYLSGPRAMVEAYENLIAQQGVDKTMIMTDYFPGY